MQIIPEVAAYSKWASDHSSMGLRTLFRAKNRCHVICELEYDMILSYVYTATKVPVRL